MIKRLLIIGAFTGAAHLSTVFVLKGLTGRASVADIKEIAEIDALLNLIIIVLGAGLLMTSVREIAISKNWQEHFIDAQKARLTLSLLFVVTALLGFIETRYFFLGFAPIFALHGDYALYGKGKPVLASLLAFLRVFVASVALYLAAVFWQNQMVNIFVAATVFMYLLAGIVISKNLRLPYLVWPDWKKIFMYVQSLYLGVVAFGYYFFGLGLIIICSFFYSEPVIALCYVLLKIYVIYKGLLRIIIQAFISEMQDDGVCKKVDQLTSLAGLALLMSATIFPDTFFSLLVDKKLEGDISSVYLIGIIGFLISPFISFSAKAMLTKKDKPYAILTTIAISASSVLCILLSYFTDSVVNILVALGAGECLCIAGLAIILKQSGHIVDRIQFVGKNALLVVVPVTFRYFFGDNLEIFLLFLVIYAILVLVLNKNKFKKILVTA